jgi:hypothetical protein
VGWLTTVKGAEIKGIYAGSVVGFFYK